MDEAPTRKGFSNWPYGFYNVSDSRFGPAQWKLMPVAERNAQIAEEKRLAAEKLAAAQAAADAAFATSPEQPPATPPAPPSDLSAPPDFSRHPRRCAICSHPDRAAIEGDFIRWCSPDRIARDYNLPDRASVYRHAHYAGLFQRRKREVACVLESLLESADSCSIEAADMIIRATRLYVRINEHGDWTEAPRTQFLITGSMRPAETPDAPHPPPRSKPSRAAAKPNPAAPKPDCRKRSRKILTARDPDSEISQIQENK
jgi:hypothetical protein